MSTIDGIGHHREEGGIPDTYERSVKEKHRGFKIDFFLKEARKYQQEAGFPLPSKPPVKAAVEAMCSTGKQSMVRIPFVRVFHKLNSPLPAEV